MNCFLVHGGFSDWNITDDDQCLELSNGSWAKPMLRFCNNPSPKYGGKDCIGENSTIICEPIHGNWSEWQIAEDDQCSKIENGEISKSKEVETDTTEGGTQMHTETADEESGKPRHTCKEHTEWRKPKYRFCTNPAPRYGGQDCIGGNSTVVCEPIHGNWSEWEITEDDQCSETEEGVWMKPKHRTCNNPAPKYGGKFCENYDLGHQDA